MDFSKIRKTAETPSRVSVHDLIGAISKVQNPRVAWADLQKRHPETVCQTYSYKADYKFPGRGNQTTPVINARGAIMIINLLPGAIAASFRAAWADIIVRYIAGDPTLASEVKRNNEIQNQLPDDDPRRFFRQDVEARHTPKSVTGVQDIRSAQVYFGSAGPPESWVDIRRPDGSPYLPKEGEHIIKFGCHDDNTGRFAEHVREYKTWEVSDSALTDNPHGTERCLKDHLRNKNALLSARHVNKMTRDTELFAGTLAIYEGHVNKAIELAQRQEHGVNMEYERELTKRMEEETKRMEHETKRMQTDSEVQKAKIQAELEIQKMQIQLEMLRLEKSVERAPQPSDQTAPQHSNQNTEKSVKAPRWAEEFVESKYECTHNPDDHVVYREHISDCLAWKNAHPRYRANSSHQFKQDLLRSAMDVFTGRKMENQRPVHNKKLPTRKCWTHVTRKDK